jgi:hypothetical protein
MVTLPLARKLKSQGVSWTPHPNDFFAIPDRELDDRVFVISEMMTNIEQIRGRPVVSFHGSAEWATDYLVTSEVVWLPRESQVRNLLTNLIGTWPAPANGTHETTVEGFWVQVSPEFCSCSLNIGGKVHQFKALHAADAYALAFLYLSKHDRELLEE